MHYRIWISFTLLKLLVLAYLRLEDETKLLKASLQLNSKTWIPDQVQTPFGNSKRPQSSARFPQYRKHGANSAQLPQPPRKLSKKRNLRTDCLQAVRQQLHAPWPIELPMQWVPLWSASLQTSRHQAWPYEEDYLPTQFLSAKASSKYSQSW